MTFLGKVDVPRTPGILPGEVLEKVQAVPIHIHKFDQNLIVRFDRIAGKVDALTGEMRLQSLLKDVPIPFHTHLHAFHHGVKMRIIHSRHPHLHSGNLCTNSHAVPSI